MEEQLLSIISNYNNIITINDINIYQYILFILIFLPLIGSLVSGLFGSFLGYKGSPLFSTTSVIISALLSIIIFFKVIHSPSGSEIIEFNIINWLDIDSIEIGWNFRCDTLTASMLIPVLVVSSLVHLYAMGYMEADPHQPRFFSYLSMFTFFMVILVTADNYLMLFVGWEFIGVASYLLISFWFTRLQAVKSALSAILLNRFGDTFLTIGLFATIWCFGTLDFKSIFSISNFINPNVITFISICFLLGAMAKSAQLGPHIWLSLAMEGPTPVSALLHAATMVTAGVYLLMRSSPLLEYSPTVLVLCLWVGGFTTLVAGLIAIASNDIKRVIAYSTMAQLGMMVIAIGLSSYNMALFHLFCHAFFKALLFMSAGSIIHSIASESQDMRKYGGLLQFLPFTYLSILIASLSLMAIPGLTGFYSKDIIIESSFGSFTISGFIMYWISVISATLTSGYSIRVLYLTFLSPPNSPRNIYTKVHEPGLTMGIPMIILTIFSIFIGYLTKDFYLGIGGNSLLFNVLFIHPNHAILPDTEFGVPTLFKILPLFTSLGFSIICFISYEFFPNTFFNFTNLQFVKIIYSFFNQKFFFDAILNNVILRSGLSISGILNKSIDKGALQFLGPRGLSYILLKFSNNLSIFESGYVTYYSLHFITVTIIFFLIFTFFNIYIPLIYLILLFINYQVKD